MLPDGPVTRPAGEMTAEAGRDAARWPGDPPGG